MNLGLGWWRVAPGGFHIPALSPVAERVGRREDAPGDARKGLVGGTAVRVRRAGVRPPRLPTR
jgi:hypothetical protein